MLEYFERRYTALVRSITMRLESYCIMEVYNNNIYELNSIFKTKTKCVK